jgi:hypothetical protein
VSLASSSTSNIKYRPRTAAAIRLHSQDASELLLLGVSPHEVSDLLGISSRELA